MSVYRSAFRVDQTTTRQQCGVLLLTHACQRAYIAQWCMCKSPVKLTAHYSTRDCAVSVIPYQRVVNELWFVAQTVVEIDVSHATPVTSGTPSQCTHDTWHACSIKYWEVRKECALHHTVDQLWPTSHQIFSHLA